ncbi:MAG: hypothetical protein HYV04_12775 [Deltaproteobacteria bacterium]|nr:hypothetical protein [Deltaproteobacteria bacterium]
MNRVTVDVGGTFTDCLVLGESGDIYAFKAPRPATIPGQRRAPDCPWDHPFDKRFIDRQDCQGGHFNDGRISGYHSGPEGL